MILVLLLISLVFSTSKYPSCKYPGKPPGYKPVITEPLPHTYINANDLPASYDWRNVDGVNYVSSSKNQHIPQYCGACWAINSLSALADRFRIKRKNAWPDYEMAVQAVLYCVENGCHGGWPESAYSYAQKHGVPTETCMNFVAEGTGEQCSDFNTCRTCDFDIEEPKKKCYAVKNYTLLFADNYGDVSGEQKMMAEIYARGPIGCGIAVTQEVDDYKGGIFHDKTGARQIGHEISVVGWGEEDGVKFWVIRNSWGEYWGETGFMRLIRGINNLAIEEDCAFATPGEIRKA